MGCDIHVYTEKKLDNGKWWCCDHFQLNEYYDESDPDDGERIVNIVPIYNGRDYALFETLAGVRAYYGNEQMDEPRGLPKDVSKIVQEESDNWGSDGHSHSWFTAKELFDWQASHSMHQYSGMVSPQDAERLDNGEFPRSWCQSTNIEGYVHRTWQESGCTLDILIDAVKKRMGEEFWIWDWLDGDKKEARYKECADKFRIVFWFDN